MCAIVGDLSFPKKKINVIAMIWNEKKKAKICSCRLISTAHWW